MRKTIVAGLALLAALVPAHAKDEKPAETPAVFQAVLDCTKLTDPTARLRCFDASVATLDTAARAKEISVMDRGTMREARRGLFGLGLPRLKLFGGDESEDVVAIDSTIKGVRIADDRMPVFVLEDGARWKQTEGRNVFAKVGQPIHIRRAAMGSFMANVNKQPGVRVTRISN